jgi:transposase InsO family protein
VVPVQAHPADSRVGRLLPHVLEATAHAQRLRAVPGRAVSLLSTVGNSLRDIGQLDTARPVLDHALYNRIRPHQALDARTPRQAYLDT